MYGFGIDIEVFKNGKNMKISTPLVLKWVFVICSQCLMMGCAVGQKMVYHSFGFDSAESVDVDILDWQYGARNAEYDGLQQSGLRARASQVNVGKPFNSGGATGGMPVGDFLYVKWRIKTSGEIHEDRVDLTKLLPRDMTYHGIHFIVKNTQLYIYLIPPAPPGAPPFHDPGISQRPWPSGDYFASVRGDPEEIANLSKLN